MKDKNRLPETPESIAAEFKASASCATCLCLERDSNGLICGHGYTGDITEANVYRATDCVRHEPI